MTDEYQEKQRNEKDKFGNFYYMSMSARHALTQNRLLEILVIADERPRFPDTSYTRTTTTSATMRTFYHVFCCDFGGFPGRGFYYHNPSQLQGSYS